MGLDYAWVLVRALGKGPWVCLNVHAHVNSQGNGKASGFTEAKFQSVLSWEGQQYMVQVFTK